MRLIGCYRLLPLVAIPLAVFLGCNKPASDADAVAESTAHDHDHEHGDHDHKHADHDHEDGEDHPKTYAEALEKLKALQTTVREALAAGETDKADDAVHEVGHVLEDIPKLAEKAVAEAKHEDVKKDVEELFDHFGKLDDEIHSGKEVSFDEMSKKIDAAIERLGQHIEK